MININFLNSQRLVPKHLPSELAYLSICSILILELLAENDD